MEKFQKYLKTRKEIIDRSLILFIRKLKAPRILKEAMKYMLSAGKRIRPILTIASYEIFKKDWKFTIPVCCAIEMVHTYSLIHDDLPCMDDDDYRRGKPSCHKKYNEAIAVLTGDSLLTYAFEIIAENFPEKTGSQLIKTLSKAAGPEGMIAGQILDIESTNHKPSRRYVDQIHLNKTARMISAAIKCGVICAQANQKDQDLLERFGLYIGRAFQIIDDILDIEGTKKVLGKTPGKDIQQHKLTYPSVVGLEKSKQIAKKLVKESQKILNFYSPNSKILSYIAEYIINRKK